MTASGARERFPYRSTLWPDIGVYGGSDGGGWAAGPAFTLADCPAAPTLYYARVVHRWDENGLFNLTRYFER